LPASGAVYDPATDSQAADKETPMTTALMRGDTIFTLHPYREWPNPLGWRWRIFRDGLPVGGAATKAEARRKIDAGEYDPAEVQK
jgi:hypothetical protein